MSRRAHWAGSSVKINDRAALAVLDNLRAKALADQRALNARPLVDSKLVATASLDALGLPGAHQ